MSRDNCQSRLAAKKGEAARDTEVWEKLEVELHDANLKLQMMENWKKMVTNAHQKAAAPLSEFAEAECEFRTFAEKRSVFKGWLAVVEAEPVAG